jgi:hypothetical protein
MSNTILCDAHTPPLRRFNQEAEVAVTGKQHHLANIFGELHGIDGEPDVHVTLHPSPCAGRWLRRILQFAEAYHSIRRGQKH